MSNQASAAAEEIVLMPSNERPTAVFAANDLLAIGLVARICDRWIASARRYGDCWLRRHRIRGCRCRTLSSVRQPRLAIGYRAAELLFDEIEAIDSDARHDHQQVRFTPELVVRRSSAKSRNSAPLFDGPSPPPSGFTCGWATAQCPTSGRDARRDVRRPGHDLCSTTRS